MSITSSVLRLSSALALLAALLVVATPARAQTGSLSGTVVDDKGNPMTFTDVSLEPMPGFTHDDSTLTDETGSYRFAGVPVGNYKLSAFSVGFKMKDQIVDIGVGPGSTQTFTITLLPEKALEETKVVRAKYVDIVDPTKTETSMSLESGFISKIPLQNKRIQDIVALFPGVTKTGSSDSTDISIGGGTSAQVGYRLNSMNINDPVNGGPLLDVSTAAIQSVKLITGGFNAEYGEQSSGITEIVTKAGTDAIDFSYGLDFRDTDYGAQSISGLDEAATNLDNILRADGTLLESELATGFRLLGVDPVSTTEDDNNPTPRHRVRHAISAGGPVVRDKVYFHATLESLSDDYGSPYTSGTDKNDQLLFNSKLNWNLFQGKGKSNTLELTANVDVSDNSGFNGLFAPRSVNNIVSNSAWTVGVDDINVFNDTTVLDSKLNLIHTTTAFRPEDVRTGVGTQYNIALPPGGFATYTVGAAGLSFDETIDNVRGETSLSKSFKHHNFKTGVSYQQTSFKSYEADGDDVSDLRVLNERAVFATSPHPGNVVQYGQPTRTDDSSWQASLFVQDSWQVTDNLALDVGLRADYQSFVGRLFLGPRFGFSLDPIGDGKTRFFGNAGLFYDNIFTNALQFAQTPETSYGELRFTGPFLAAGNARFSQIPITEIYKEALATPLGSTDPDSVAYIVPTTRQRYKVDDNIGAPLSTAWTMGIERQLPGHTRVQLSYQSILRSDQLRTRTETIHVGVDPGDRDVRDVILESTGHGKYEQWAFEFQRPFSDKWEMNMSYVQSHNTGPIAPPDNPIDPNDVYYVQGTLGNDRTHVVKLQTHANVGKKAKIDMSGDFTWQTGTPLTANFVLPDGSTLYPLGRNTLRLPASRQLNFGMQRAWKTADGALNITGRMQFFNLMNELNVFGAIPKFRTPAGSADPDSFPPLRPELVITNVDVSRSMEVGVVIGF